MPGKDEKIGHDKKNPENVLIVIAHPNTDKSFNHKLAKAASDTLFKLEHDVITVDLYKMNWQSQSGPKDFLKHEDETNFDYQKEQKNASLNKGFTL